MRSPNQINRIDEFLKHIAYIISSNPDLYQPRSEYTAKLPDTIYSELIKFGLEKKDRNTSVEYLFNYWVEHYKNDPRVNCFVSPSWKSFCQFRHGDCNGMISGSIDPIKLYIPLKPERLQYGVEQIFDFCAQNNITNLSKVRKTASNDVVVIRVTSKEDAEKIISFVSRNEYLRTGLNPISPFSFAKDGVGMAVDNSHSYNNELSKIIAEYFQRKIRANLLHTISYNDFIEYVNNIGTYGMTDINEIKELARKAISPRTDINDYYEHYKSVKRNKKAETSKYQPIDHYDGGLLKAFHDVVMVTLKKNGEEYTRIAIERYISLGYAQHFSRYNEQNTTVNYREVFMSYASMYNLEYGSRLNMLRAATNSNYLDQNELISIYVASLKSELSSEYAKNKSR